MEENVSKEEDMVVLVEQLEKSINELTIQRKKKSMLTAIGGLLIFAILAIFLVRL